MIARAIALFAASVLLAVSVASFWLFLSDFERRNERWELQCARSVEAPSVVCCQWFTPHAMRAAGCTTEAPGTALRLNRAVDDGA